MLAASEELVHNYGTGEHVNALTILAVVRDLRRHVDERAAVVVHARVLVVAIFGAEPEIGDLHDGELAFLLRHEDVVRLQVAVDYPILVQIRHCTDYLSHNKTSLLVREAVFFVSTYDSRKLPTTY